MLTRDQIRELAISAGFAGHALDIAVAVCLAESSGDANAMNLTTPEQAAAWNAAHPGRPKHGPERSFGLWQINTLASPQYDEQRLFEPEYNAHAAFELSQGGKDWRHWGAFTDGGYLHYMPGGLP